MKNRFNIPVIIGNFIEVYPLLLRSKFNHIRMQKTYNSCNTWRTINGNKFGIKLKRYEK